MAVYQESLFTASITFRKNCKNTQFPLAIGLKMKILVWARVSRAFFKTS